MSRIFVRFFLEGDGGRQLWIITCILETWQLYSDVKRRGRKFLGGSAFCLL
jgi:hypothetical protein